MTATPPVRQPMIRLAPAVGQDWTRDDYDSASRALEWMRLGFAVLAGQYRDPDHSATGVAARTDGVTALSAAHKELGHLLDRIATIEMGIEDGPLPAAP